METETFRKYVSGRLPIEWPLMERAARAWPINERDLLPVHNDVPVGVLFHTKQDSEASARILTRGGANYYEYSDTAMSRLASYRPEKIRMLRTVHDNHPVNPAIEWNEGHLLYQFTYFIGPVNYYHRLQGDPQCVPMNTGDSVWGVPFAPHSFASRCAGEDAYILALTYGGDLLGDVQRELSVLGPSTAARLALPTGSSPSVQAAILTSLITARLLTDAEVARISGLQRSRLDALKEGRAEPSWRERNALASALQVSVRDLLPRHTSVVNGASVQHYTSALRWTYPDSEHPTYEIVRLAGDLLHPDTTAFELQVLTPDLNERNAIVTYQHSYLYVLDPVSTTISWTFRESSHFRELHPGDSAYIAPGVSIAFTNTGSSRAKVLLLRIGSAVTADVRFALSSLTTPQLQRYLWENQLWYRPEGRQHHPAGDDRRKT